jgi:hypothetical protein
LLSPLHHIQPEVDAQRAKAFVRPLRVLLSLTVRCRNIIWIIEYQSHR